MSGIFGAMDTRGRRVCTAIESIAMRLCILPTQQAEYYCSPSECESIGRVSIGVFNQSPQPVWNQSKSIGVVFAGRLLRDHPLQAHQHDAYWVLSLYQEHGVRMAEQLRGSFALAIYDVAQQRVLVAADRLGTYPIYYGHRNGQFRFGPTQNSLLCNELFPPELDLTGLAQYMRFQHLLHDVTFFSSIKRLPGGHQLLYDVARDSLCTTTYWHPEPNQPIQENIRFEEAAEETSRLVVQAVERCCRGEARIGLFLSGGLDSRILLAALGRLGYTPPTLTYGLPNSRDVHYAKRVARLANAPHYLCLQPNGEWVKQYWQPHLRLTDGSHSWIHMHGIYALNDARRIMDVNLSGYTGDTLLRGLVLKNSYLRQRDEMCYASQIFRGLNEEETWPGMTETDEQLLYTPDLLAQTKGRAFASLQRALAPYLTYPEPLRTEWFFMQSSEIRLYGHYIGFMRAAIEMGLPFADPDLIDFVGSLPIQYRTSRRLAHGVLSRLSGPLSRIPYDQDELLPTDRSFLRSAHRFAMRARRRLDRLMGRSGVARSTLHSDYENWLRTDLRDWAESILFDRRAAERGLFDPVFVRSLWQRHLAGTEAWTLGKIAPVIGYELIMREFVDGAAVPPAISDRL